MEYWILNIVSAFLLCVFFAGFIIPQILLIAFRNNLFDGDGDRKIHRGNVPRLGGLAFKPVIFLTIALLLGTNLALGYTDLLAGFEDEIRPLAFLFSAVMMLYLVGMADDLVGVEYNAKFVAQVLCGLLLVAGGIGFHGLYGLLGFDTLAPWLAAVFTVIMVVFVVNAINLIDGIDGLASGLCSCALLVYGIAFFLLEGYAYSLLSFATLGVLVPFFYYNVYGDPEKRKKIFMGDTGALTVGLILCFLAFRLSVCSEGNAWDMNPLVMAFAPLIIPCFDVVRVYFGRVRRHRNPFLPDKTHIHHKLLDLGVRHRHAMFTIVSSSILTIVCNLLLSTVLNISLLLLLDMVVWVVVNLWLTKCIKNQRK